ncbi:hypothetical protein [Enterococcus casseliflavus]|uniref:hypothetical protein n=1 Tax=Enterococcus casseliflavus TaxID=37734 RepID=UPI0039A67EC1
MTTINDVISWKHEPNEKFGSHYIFFFVNTENNLISKSNGADRINQDLKDFDYDAKLYIVHQFMKAGKIDAGNELFGILQIDSNKTFLDNKYSKELLDNF